MINIIHMLPDKIFRFVFPQIFQSLSTSCDFPDISPGAIPLRSFRDATKCVSDLRVKLEVTLEEAWPRIPVTGKTQ